MTARTSFLDSSEWMKRGFQAAQDRGHLGRLDVLVHVFRVMRLEQLGELLAGVVHEVGERLQPGQDDQVAGIEPLPQVVAGQRRVDEHVVMSGPSLVVPGGQARAVISHS